jgi:hypothetical protein
MRPKRGKRMDTVTLIALVGGIGGFVGGLGGLIAGLAALKTAQDAIRIAQASKPDPHRMALYEKQLNALGAILELWGEFLYHESRVSGLLTCAPQEALDELKVAYNTFENINSVLGRSLWILPPGCASALTDEYSRVSSARSLLTDVLKSQEWTNGGKVNDDFKQAHAKYMEEVSKAVDSAMRAAREVLGYYPLYVETSQIFQKMMCNISTRTPSITSCF